MAFLTFLYFPLDWVSPIPVKNVPNFCLKHDPGNPDQFLFFHTRNGFRYHISFSLDNRTQCRKDCIVAAGFDTDKFICNLRCFCFSHIENDLLSCS